MKTARMTVNGMLVGTGFEEATAQQAQALKVRGYVKMLPDGRAEVLAQGEAEAMTRLYKFVKQGPPGCLVTECAVQNLPSDRELPDGFAAL